MRTIRNGIALAGLVCLFAAPGVQADRLLIDSIQQTSVSNNTSHRQGQTMDQVRGNLGEPQQRISAVGEPPISRWVYDGYTIYFEHNLVLHTVQQR